MKLAPIIDKIRDADTSLGDNIAGAAELAVAFNQTLNSSKQAFVIQLSEAAQANAYDSGINQAIVERFGVVVMLNNADSDREKTGVTAHDQLDDIRGELLAAILGWMPPNTETILAYIGSRLVKLTRARLWHQFEFQVTTRIIDDDGYDNGADDLGPLDDMSAQWVLGPNANIPAAAAPVFFETDMDSLVDFTSNPEVDGSFDRGYHIGFSTFKG